LPLMAVGANFAFLEYKIFWQQSQPPGSNAGPVFS
jgi:hypothetical protein